MTARRIVAGILLLMAMFCWRLGRNNAHALERKTAYTTLSGVSDLTAARWTDMCKQEAKEPAPTAFALWAQQDGVASRAVVSGREGETLALIRALGDTRLILPGAAALGEDDSAGCLVDARTAQALTGNGDAVGLAVTLDGAEYRIRGVVDCPLPVAVVRPATDDQIMTQVTLPEEVDADAFALRHGLTASLAVRGELYGAPARLLQWLPVFAAGAIALVRLLRLRRRWRVYPLRTFALEMLCFAIVTGTALLLLAVFPAAIVPTRWSDFSHWGRLLNESGAYLLRYFSIGRHCQDYVMLHGLAASLPGAATAVLVTWSSAAMTARTQTE